MLIKTDAHHAKPSINLDNSMIPAINVVFLLLVFFMIAGQIKAHNELLEIPVSESKSELQEQTFEIKILANGNRLLNGQKVTGSLQEALIALQVNTDSSLNLHIHKDLPVTQLDPILVAARQLGVERLLIVTERLP